MLISVKLFPKYVIIFYALGSVHEKFGVWIKAVPKAKLPAGLGEKNWLGVPKTDSDAELFTYLI